ncbi:hypothetical protein ACHAXS_005137 [Conticribra weissflogii]
MDPTYLHIDNDEFANNAKEPIPPNNPKLVDIYMFVNTNHAGDKQTWHPCRGFLIYVKTAILDWYLKHQAPIET